MRLSVAHVQVDGHGGVAGSIQTPGHVRGGRVVEVTDGHPESCGVQGVGNGRAQAVGATGYESDVVGPGGVFGHNR